MVISSRLLSHKVWQNLHRMKTIAKEARASSSFAQATKPDAKFKNNDFEAQIVQETVDVEKEKSFANHRFIYPEFLPDPNPIYRNSVREKLERMDMLARRSVVNIPEFYVGSILSITYAEPHAKDKVNTFVGICILREGCGLRASIILRNVVDGEAIEVRYDLYDPAIKKITCLRLEKRLDDEILYLRDAPLSYSTFPFDMDPELIIEGAPVPVNDIIIPLNPQPWSQKWELRNMKGIENIVINAKRQRKAAAAAKPWEKYDLMKIYRETIPEEEQNEIYADVNTALCQLEAKKNILQRRRTFSRPRKVV